MERWLDNSVGRFGLYQCLRPLVIGLVHGLAGSAAVALLVGWVYLAHPGQNWGDASATAGAIPATMVNAIPLPPKQPTDQDNILATDTPSPAPVIPASQTVETPKADAIPIPVKPSKPAKIADKTTPRPHFIPSPPRSTPIKSRPAKLPASASP